MPRLVPRHRPLCEPTGSISAQEWWDHVLRSAERFGDRRPFRLHFTSVVHIRFLRRRGDSMAETLSYDPRISNEGITPNARRLLLAGFMSILVAGVGFSIRGAILGDWARAYGFSDTALGKIGGAGLSGFCFGIIIGGLLADKIGYGSPVLAALFAHILSAVVSLIVPAGASQPVAYLYLYWGSFIFAVANGTLEAVANPLVATIFPHNRTHYLNILHASWPAGLVIGAFLAWVLGSQMHIGWKMQLGLFMVPVVGYGVLFL